MSTDARRFRRVGIIAAVIAACTFSQAAAQIVVPVPAGSSVDPHMIPDGVALDPILPAIPPPPPVPVLPPTAVVDANTAIRTDGGPTCSIAAVGHQGPFKMALTAGHCVRHVGQIVINDYTGEPIGVVSTVHHYQQSPEDSLDYAFIILFGNVPLGWSPTAYGAPSQWVCKHGIASGHTCGPVVDFFPGWAVQDAQMVNIPGDSGGRVVDADNEDVLVGVIKGNPWGDNRVSSYTRFLDILADARYHGLPGGDFIPGA